MDDPWASFNPQPAGSAADSLNRPVIVKGVAPTPPTEVFRPMTPQERTSYGIPETAPAIINGSGKPEIVNLPGGADKNSYTPMSTEQKQSAGLDPRLPFYIGSNGLPTLPGGAKAADAPVDPAVARDHAIQILGAVDHANKLLSNPLSTGLPGSLFGHVPGTDAYTLRSLIGDTGDPNNPGQISGDLRQQGIAYLRALNGGNGVGTVARSQQEQAALQSAMSNIRQGLPAADLQTALGNVRQLYLSGLARSFNLDPNDPTVAHVLATTPTEQLLTTIQGMGKPAPTALPPGSNTPVKAGETITASAPPPAITATSAPNAVSGSEQAVVNPALAKIAPQLEQYLAADPNKVSNAMILGFMQKNGVDPSSTNVMGALQYRMTKDGAAWRARGGNYGIDPHFNVPLNGFNRVRAAVDASNPGGVPVGSALVGAADTASLGSAPDVAGIVHDVTGLGPTRSDVVAGRDISAAEHPMATLLGNLGGGFASLPGGGEASALARAGKAAGSGGLYGLLGSDDPSVSSRLFNGVVGAGLGLVAHGTADVGGRLAQGGYRAAAKPIESLVNGSEATADKYALNTAARKMPSQSLADVEGANVAASQAGVPAPAAASINRAGQDYLARAASGSPAARAVADQVASDTRKAIPEELAGDFNSAIEAAAPKGVDTSAYLNRPVRDIASDIQGMAGREFERGIEPIKGQKLTITPEVISDLDHERVQGAVRDALANHSLDEGTREELRTLIPQLKTVSGAPEFARQQYAKGIPLTVDGARNIATALDRTAGKMADGTEGQVELSRLSRDIRGAIADQFPEYGPVNARYASRMRAKEAMFSARQNFFASNPDQIDALAKSSKNYTETPNEGEYMGQREVGSLKEFSRDGNERSLLYTGPDGKQANIHLIIHPNGVGEISVDPFSSDTNRFGPSLLRDAGKQLRRAYPELKTLMGERQSGANPGRVQTVAIPNGNPALPPQEPTPLPSNRQLAGAGAREATTVKAGESGSGTADRLANNVNQQANNATVLGQPGADTVGSRAAVRATNAEAVNRVASGATTDKTEGWFNLVKQAAALKATGGTAHYALAHVATAVPGLSSQDAARVVRLYLNADSAPQVLQSLSSAYGAKRARFIMARMAAVTAAASGVRGFQQPPGK